MYWLNHPWPYLDKASSIASLVTISRGRILFLDVIHQFLWLLDEPIHDVHLNARTIPLPEGQDLKTSIKQLTELAVNIPWTRTMLDAIFSPNNRALPAHISSLISTYSFKQLDSVAWWPVKCQCHSFIGPSEQKYCLYISTHGYAKIIPMYLITVRNIGKPRQTSGH